MPSAADFEALDTTAYQIGPIVRTPEIIRHRMGAGYGVKVNVGASAGLWGFTLEQTPLPDNTTLETIGGMSSYDYYVDFFDRHTAGAKDVFQIEFNGKKYHVSVVEGPSFTGEQLTSDLFMGGEVVLEQRRVRGIYYRSDGSIFDPSFLTTGIWGWFKGGSYTSMGGGVYRLDDQFGAGANDLTSSSTQVTPVANVVDTNVNSLGVMRLNNSGTGGYFSSTADPTIYEAFFLFKVSEATFSTYQGILTCDASNANPGNGGLLIGSNGTTKLENLAFGGVYTYKKNAVTFAEADQQAPMNTFGVIHGRWSGGVPVTNLMIGWDRSIAGRYLKGDLCEIVLCDALLSTADSADMDGYMMRRGGIA